MRDFSQAKLKVFPPIGVARVGDSEKEWFVGPETPGVVPEVASYKDAAGRMLRQGARFHVFAFFPDGNVEALDLAHDVVAAVDWEVELANAKAAWHEFGGARRVATVLQGGEAPLRNKGVTGDARLGLEIRPTAASISGAAARSRPIEGEFRHPEGDGPTKVRLGELRTDKLGRLIVLGGAGSSGSVIEDNPLAHYANNDRWYDDTSDGPVRATVRLKSGESLEAERAWVVVAPPHYSPHTPNVVTLFDAMAEAAVKHGLDWPEKEYGPAPDLNTTSFTHDVYPLLERLSHYPWLNARSHRGHAARKRGAFIDEEMLKVLKEPWSKPGPSPHGQFFKRLRTPLLRPLYGAEPFKVAIDPQSLAARNQATLYYMPALSGDEGDVTHGEPESWFTLTEMQYFHLSQWKDGKFVADWPGAPPKPAARSIDNLPPAERPAALTRAALEMGQGGAFFPGIEVASIIRDPQFYNGAAFRISPNYRAGDVTKWMALPWQADFYECAGHWWPTVRPDDIVPGHEYDRIKRADGARGDLRPLLIARKSWTRGLNEKIPDRPAVPGPTPDEVAVVYFDRAARWTARVLRPAIGRYLPSAMENERGDAYRRRLEEFLERAFQKPPETIGDLRSDVDNEAFLAAATGVVRHAIGGPPGLPEPDHGEPVAKYRERVTDYVVNALKLPPDILVELTLKRDAGAFRAALLRKLLTVFADDLRPPMPQNPGGPATDYVEANEDWFSNPVLQGALDLEWRRRNRNRGKNDLQASWSGLGVVRPAESDGVVLIERDRERFDLLPFRQYFHLLMNIEANPEFLPKAQEIGQKYFDLARAFETDVIASDPELYRYRFFDYDAVTFQARLEEIYESEKRAGEAFDPVTADGSEAVFSTPARVVERIRQLAPFNQLDGSWLERIAKAGPIDDVQSALFEIWSDEIGGGDPTKNHANVYVDLMRAAGIHMPPLNSLAYANHPDLWEGSFESPVYQACTSLFPERFYPELLGMTLYLEWEAVYLPAMVKLYDYFGYSSLFYRLHVAIDNPVNGHGARARDAVVRYLNDVRAKGGDKEMQEHWRRIWDGYLAFKFVGAGEWDYRFANPPSVDERMAAMVEGKRQYGQLNHGSRRFAGNLINDWFDEPDQFLAALAESDLIVRGRPGVSPFFAVTGQTGPMLKVFSEKELDLWAEWIASLPPDPVEGQDPASEMLVVLRELSARAESVSGHEGPRLKGKYEDPISGDPVDAEQSVAWWFSIRQPKRLLAAIADPVNNLVVPGQPDKSRLVNEFLRPARPMARFMARAVPELGDVSAREIVVRWIKANCPLPEAPPAGALRARSLLMTGKVPGRADIEGEDYDAEVIRTTLASPPQRPHSRRSRLRASGPGGGAVH